MRKPNRIDHGDGERRKGRPYFNLRKAIKMSNVMLDLEFMGKGPDAAITAIGAVKFGMDGLMCEPFYLPIDLQSSVDLGMRMDVSTVLWWMGQSDEAQAIYKDNRTCGTVLAAALARFSIWSRSGTSPRVWGNGSDIDNVILSTAYRLAGLTQPWDVRDSRCYRTVKNMAPGIKLERIGTHHNALDDAKSQALHLIKICEELNLAIL